MHTAITSLPTELHYTTFGFLDQIDSTCLGLTNKHFYAMHLHLHGFVPLSSRRESPNNLEWAWCCAETSTRHAHHPQDSDATVTATTVTSYADADVLEPTGSNGHASCRICGIFRCELHRHIRQWLGATADRTEYCLFTGRYGPPARKGARIFCYMPNPKMPNSCGRHIV